MQNYVGKQIDRYRIIERLGMGGMAVVYKAYDARLERDVALKLIRVDEIPPSQHERLMKRFEREAKAMARFSHPNIVPVYDYGEVDGTPYLVMEFVPGGTLKERINKPVPYQQAIQWLTPIADALRYAHERNVFHRDVKPSNILFDSEERSLLTDFGIAKVLETDEATLTGTGLGVGTPEYMAPEQWQGQTSEATDQYALGVVLYELITGRKPYSADTPAAIILMQANEPLQAPSGLVQGIPAAVEKVLYKALARNPEDRYESMDAFARALRGLLAESETAEPVLPNQTAQPMEPSPEVAATSHSEGVTRDALDATSTEGIPQQAMSGEKKKGLPKWAGWAFAGIVGLVLITLAFNLGSKSANPRTSSVVPEVEEPTTAPSETTAPTLTATIAITAEPTLGIGSTMINKIDGAEMAFIPAGEFKMGNSEDDIEKLKNQEWCTSGDFCQANTYSSEIPSNIVFVNSFWIGIHEVTKDQYNQCIDSGICDPLAEEPWNYEHFGKSDSLDYPVLTANWFQANTYCEWIGGRLPTEAEWEKAARGTDGRIFPWGDNAPTKNLANYNVYGDYVSEVGSYPDGASPYGALDMAGNVWEWVSDWFDENYYSTNENWINPSGPLTGTYKVMRGGSTSVYWAIRTTTRFAELPENPDFLNFSIGFRCVMDEGWEN